MEFLRRQGDGRQGDGSKTGGRFYCLDKVDGRTVPLSSPCPHERSKTIFVLDLFNNKTLFYKATGQRLLRIQFIFVYYFCTEWGLHPFPF